VKVVLIFLTIFISLYFYFSQKPNQFNSKISQLPSFTSHTVSGKIINSNKLENNLFVIFINTNEDYHIDLLRNVYLNYVDKNLNIT